MISNHWQNVTDYTIRGQYAYEMYIKYASLMIPIKSLKFQPLF